MLQPSPEPPQLPPAETPLSQTSSSAWRKQWAGIPVWRLAIYATLLCKAAGLDAVLLVFSDHVAVGICADFKGFFYPVDGKKYFYAETTAGPFCAIGDRPIEKYQKHWRVIKL